MSNAYRILIVPGYTNSGPEHWQTLWEADDPSLVRVQQRDWNWPDGAEWSAAIDAAVRASDVPAVLVGHSCGSIAIAHFGARYATPIAGAVIVAPTDVEMPHLNDEIRAAGPVPRTRLPFPSLVIASDDDPYCSPERTREFANAWGSDVTFIGSRGHINSSSGLGNWPEGRRIVREFCERLALVH